MTKWRTVLTVASFIYCAGLIFFALHPTTEIKWGEWVIVVVAGVAAIMLFIRTVPGVHLPGERFAFLFVGWAGFMGLLFYLIDTADDPTRRVGIALFLLAGMFAGYGSFLAEDQTSEKRRL